MFLGLQGEYICSVSDNREELEAVKDIAGFTSIVETDEPVEYIDGQYFVGADNIHNAMSNARAIAYGTAVDPITSHIQRLRDIDPVPQDEINELLAERDAKVQEIKERYPYPVGE